MLYEYMYVDAGTNLIEYIRTCTCSSTNSNGHYMYFCIYSQVLEKLIGFSAKEFVEVYIATVARTV